MSESKTIPNKLPYAMVESSCVSFSDKKLVKAKTTPYFVFLGIIQERKLYNSIIYDVRSVAIRQRLW